jgi:hypothetical protein
MRFQSGKHEGKTTEQVFLKFPDWAASNMWKHPDTKHSREFRQLRNKFDAKPLKVRCHGRCGKIATRASAYLSSPTLKVWCEDCNPDQSGSSTGKLTMVRTFDDAVDHIGRTARGNRHATRKIVRALAKAKGLPVRVGEKEAKGFFIQTERRPAQSVRWRWFETGNAG